MPQDETAPDAAALEAFFGFKLDDADLDDDQDDGGDFTDLEGDHTDGDADADAGDDDDGAGDGGSDGDAGTDGADDPDGGAGEGGGAADAGAGGGAGDRGSGASGTAGAGKAAGTGAGVGAAKPGGAAGDGQAGASGAPAGDASQTPEVRYDEHGNPLDEEGYALDDLGMRIVTKEEWEEWFAESPGEAGKAYQDYMMERGHRQAARTIELNTLRDTEIKETRQEFAEVFDKHAEAADFIQEEVGKILAHVPEAERLRPGYYQKAAALVIAADLPGFLKKFGVSAALLAGEADDDPDQGDQPATPPVAAAKARPGARSVKLAGKPAGGATPPPSAGGGSEARGNAAAIANLTADQKAMAKSLGMSLADYAANL